MNSVFGNHKVLIDSNLSLSGSHSFPSQGINATNVQVQQNHSSFAVPRKTNAGTRTMLNEFWISQAVSHKKTFKMFIAVVTSYDNSSRFEQLSRHERFKNMKVVKI